VLCDFEATIEERLESAAADLDRATFKQFGRGLPEKIPARCSSGYEIGGLQGKSRRFNAAYLVRKR
jgi:hypothetical protein